ncbi:Ig-like domain-containing protein, partial [Rodentibacter ratti]|uniref:Ig-like domain-containing protein n=1 Tax=Rodentibacter ratti TaxID=1906745 RepID=UPI0015C2F324
PSASVSPDGTAVTGKTEPNAKVTVTLPNGDTVTATAGEDGNYTVPLSPALTNGEEVKVTATDKVGNKSAVTSANAPETTETVFITGREITANPTNADIAAIRDKNKDTPDVTIADNGYITGDAKNNFVAVGNGSNKGDISGSMNITNGKIETLSGDDTVIVTGKVLGSTIIDVGEGNDTVTANALGDGNGVYNINLGNGNNQLTIAQGINAGGKADRGNDKYEANRQTWGKITGGDDKDIIKSNDNDVFKANIETGAGDDEVTLNIVNTSRPRGTHGLNWTYVDLGEGNDKITLVTPFVRNSRIYGGEGDDILDLSQATFTGNNYAEETRFASSIIDGGNGNDTIILGDTGGINLNSGNATPNSYFQVKGGSGNDIVTFVKSYDPAKPTHQGRISGDDGTDTLKIEGENTSVSLKPGDAGPTDGKEGIYGFEIVDMTSAGSQKVLINLEAVQNNANADKHLFIKGDASDIIDFGPTGNGLGAFTKTADTTIVDGRSYTAYTVQDYKIFVDDTITNII